MEVPFINDFQPRHGQVEHLAEGVRRIVAPNPSPLTFRGTNTYIIGAREFTLIDPGPNLDSHLDAILSAIPSGCRLGKILVTHAHLDHSGLARRLATETGSTIFAYGDYRAGQRDDFLFGLKLAAGGEFEEGIDKSFAPDVCISDGEAIQAEDWTITPVWTPGHLGNHLCFDIREAKLMFSGDHAMTWATTVVSPPHGSMTAYLASLGKLISLGQRRLLPGHGADHSDGLRVMRYLMEHRQSRELQILDALGGRRLSAAQIADEIYAGLEPSLQAAASMNVLSHLLDLRMRGIVYADGMLSAASAFRVARKKPVELGLDILRGGPNC